MDPRSGRSVSAGAVAPGALPELLALLVLAALLALPELPELLALLVLVALRALPELLALLVLVALSAQLEPRSRWEGE